MSITNTPLPVVNPPLPTSTVAAVQAPGANPNLVIAVAKITIGDPSKDLMHVGGYDEIGNAILKKAVLIIEPDGFFEFADAKERARLLEMGAIRYPTETELMLYDKGVR
jgi:hypothetical protein